MGGGLDVGELLYSVCHSFQIKFIKLISNSI